MSNIEQMIKGALSDEAAQAPFPSGIASRARRRVRFRHATGVASITVVVVAVAVFVNASATTPTPSNAPGLGPVAAGGRTGAFSVPGLNADCAESYSMETLVERGLAFDGEVASTGPARTNRDGAEADLVAVTFNVARWFKGGNSPTVTVDMPLLSVRSVNTNRNPYKPGLRLLVSGESRWSGGIAEDGIGWMCGFTRYTDEATAAKWAEAFKR